jgi:hypothetical protein
VLYVRQVNCEGVQVTDPQDPRRVLAGLGSVAVAGEDGQTERFGVLALNNEDFGTLTGNPPRDMAPRRPRNDEAPGEQTDEAAPVDEPDQDREESDADADKA